MSAEFETVVWINNKAVLYNTGNYIQPPVINHNGKEYKKSVQAKDCQQPPEAGRSKEGFSLDSTALPTS